MSLEASLEKNTAALEKHSDILSKLLAHLAAAGPPITIAPAPEEAVEQAPQPAATPAAASGPATAAAPADAAPSTTAAAASPAAASAETAQPASTAADAPVTYAEVKPLILKINTDKGRAAATAALAKFGATKGPELKPEQFAAFVAHAREVLAS